MLEFSKGATEFSVNGHDSGDRKKFELTKDMDVFLQTGGGPPGILFYHRFLSFTSFFFLPFYKVYF